MGNISNAKIFGGIGALLMLLGIIPQTFGILGLIGFIMVFIAVKIIADESKDKDIFNNYLYSFILVIIAVVVAGAIMLMTFTAVLARLRTLKWLFFYKIIKLFSLLSNFKFIIYQILVWKQFSKCLFCYVHFFVK